MTYDRMTFQFRLWHMLLWVGIACVLLGAGGRLYHAAFPFAAFVFVIVTMINATSLTACVVLLSLSRGQRRPYAPGYWLLCGDGFRIIGLELLTLYQIVFRPRPGLRLVLPADLDDIVFVAFGCIYAVVAVYYACAARRAAQQRWKIAFLCAAVGALGMGLWATLYGAYYLGLWPWLSSYDRTWAIFPLLTVVGVLAASFVDTLKGIERDFLHLCGVGVVSCWGIVTAFFQAGAV